MIKFKNIQFSVRIPCLILIFYLLDFGLLYGQNACSGHIVSLNLRGYNRWETLQSSTCSFIGINPLDSNTLVSALKIKSVTFYVAIEKEEKFIISTSFYSKQGFLDSTYSKFYSNQTEVLPGINSIYKYNDNGFLQEIINVQNAVVDMYPPVQGCWDFYPSETIQTYNSKNNLLEMKSIIVSGMDESCCQKYKYYANELINEIYFIVNDNIRLTYIFEYTFW